jgi:hypothetical protein
MGKVVLDITMSLDGFVTGPDPGPGRGLGHGGRQLHNTDRRLTVPHFPSAREIQPIGTRRNATHVVALAPETTEARSMSGLR